jgi:hypothetical protein
MTTKHRFRSRSTPSHNGLNQGNGLAASNNGDPLTPVFDRVEKIRKPPCSVCCADLRHEIRLSDVSTCGGRQSNKLDRLR